jgi:hypothetical protein
VATVDEGEIKKRESHAHYHFEMRTRHPPSVAVFSLLLLHRHEPGRREALLPHCLTHSLQHNADTLFSQVEKSKATTAKKQRQPKTFLSSFLSPPSSSSFLPRHMTTRARHNNMAQEKAAVATAASSPPHAPSRRGLRSQGGGGCDKLNFSRPHSAWSVLYSLEYVLLNLA